MTPRNRGHADERTRARTGVPVYRRTGIAARALVLCTLVVLASARLVAAQCPDGTPPPCGRPAARAPAAPAANSVAVLPF
jgi:hypothetical protein